ncbi:MAG: hypothetical protein ACLRSW_13075 [Christensenellaceae bacterium]
MDKQNALIRAAFRIRVVRAFSREGAEQQKIDRATHVMADASSRRIFGGASVPCMLVLNLVTVLILYGEPIVFPARQPSDGGRYSYGHRIRGHDYVGDYEYLCRFEIPRAKVNCMRISVHGGFRPDACGRAAAEGRIP